MPTYSTTNNRLQLTWRDAILTGLAPDGGLLMPSTIPTFSAQQCAELRTLAFPELAHRVLLPFFDGEISSEKLEEICHATFTFDAPVVPFGDRFILELFHGPTCAFKDFGARFMAETFGYFWGSRTEKLLVLAATSGDTGSAVANAFFDKTPNAPIGVIVLYPKGRISTMQEQQLITLGHNVCALAVEGTFDDCQRLVKTALADKSLKTTCALTSANSINIARLLPQMVYYVRAWSLIDTQLPLRFTVPSGNLGNLTAGLFAARLGLPVERFIAACNRNDTLVRYLKSGQFTPAPSVSTPSNAMDVGNPSNFVRLAALFNTSLEEIRNHIAAYSCDDEQTLGRIRSAFQEAHYILDPHTAVGVWADDQYRTSTKEQSTSIILATAHPAKFSEVVESCIGRDVPMPERLREVLDRHGNRLTVANKYEEVREWVMKLGSL